jgi:hypothetical protein
LSVFRKRNVLRDGVEAQAVVVEAHGRGWVEGGGAGHWDVRLLVHFDDGTTAEVSRRVDGGDVRLPGAGDVLPVRYDADDRSRVEIDLPALRAHTQPDFNSSTPTDAEVQAVSDAWDAARANAADSMEGYQRAKAAGNTREAERLLTEGKVFNAEQVRLGNELKRLRALRPE